MKRYIVILFLASCLGAEAGERLSNTAGKSRRKEIREYKTEIQEVLNPATVDAITNMAELRTFLKKQQRIIKLLVRESVED